MIMGVRPLMTGVVQPEFTSGGSHYMSPGDFATIYNVNPLYNTGIDGSGTSIAIVGRTHPSSTNWSTFRSTMGLPINPPQVIVNGTDPGSVSTGENDEADLDVEWSGAVAKNATIKFVVSKSTSSTDGVDLSAQYIINNNLASVMSTSFGDCESSLGTAAMSFYNNLWSQAAALGITSFVSTGDSGAAGCDSGSASVGTGRAVSGLASTPYNVAVGGTQFNEGSGSYWNSTNGAGDTSAISYIPEVAWNESGTAGSSCPPGDTCSGLWSTSGGASTTYSKPSWQVAPGVPADGKRDIPDVSLSAAGHDGYLVQTAGALHVFGGTSASSPSFAGLMALIVQKTGQRQGNANLRFYQLANAQYGSGGAVVFHDITSGNNSVPGVTGYATTTGYDLATGLGSVDANALVSNWAGTGTLPSAPTIGTATAGNASISVAFTPGALGSGTLINYTADCGGVTNTGGTSPITVTGLTNGTSYTCRVKTTTAVGDSAWSASSNAVTPVSSATTLPAAPSGLSAVAISSSSIRFSWVDNANNETGFVVYRWTGSAWVQIATVGVNVTSYTDTGLQPSTHYDYWVCAQNSAGTTCAITSTPVTTQGPASVTTAPAAPSALSAVAISSSSIAFSWVDNANNETGFVVYRWNGSAWVQIATVGANVTSDTDTGLQPSKQYDYWVCAQNSAGTTCARTSTPVTTS